MSIGFNRCRAISYCDLQAEVKGLCIFHLPKFSETEKQQMPQAQRGETEFYEVMFRERLAELIEQIESDPEKIYNFRGFHFPTASFRRKTFSKNVESQDAVFNGRADFSRAVFEGEVDFFQAKFRDDANFSEANFKQKASFYDSSFEKTVTFIGATFENYKALFYETKFNDKALFGRVEFNEGAIFSDTVFNKEARFSNATLDKDVIFLGDTNEESEDIDRDKGFKSACAFNGLKLRETATVIFEKVNLEKASFLDTNVENISFRNVLWLRPKIRPRREKALWDEFRSEPPRRKYEKIVENYRQLVINYEKKRDYDSAEDFHIGEMEIRRKLRTEKAKRHWYRKGWAWANPYWLYRVLSNYGTSYGHALMIVAGMVLLFSLCFLYAGFQASKETAGGPKGVMEYNFFPDSGHHTVSLSQWFSDYKEAVLFTLSIITFQRERFYEPVGWQSRLLLFISVFFLTSQLALLFLAIRRRFKR